MMHSIVVLFVTPKADPEDYLVFNMDTYGKLDMRGVLAINLYLLARLKICKTQKEIVA